MDKCGSYSCTDKSQCGKKGYVPTPEPRKKEQRTGIIETDSFIVEMEAPAPAKNDGKAKCGSSCGTQSSTHPCHGKWDKQCCN